mmetsp:Transcript_56330/g.127810  ORF Transcript_56330/g.127810 Transcript_56330/m.127810 type:complete len:253 (+) Transcript_56330:137-895(+)
MIAPLKMKDVDPTALMAVRVAPFVVAAGLVFSRRTHAFHLAYLRATLRRPMRQHQSSPHAAPGVSVVNPVLDQWLASALSGHQKRVLHVVAGDSLLGKSSTTLRHVSDRRGVYVDLLAARSPDDVRKITLNALVAQSSPVARFLTPLKLDLRTTLPLAVRPRELPPWLRRLAPRSSLPDRKNQKPVIVIDSAENLFCKDAKEGGQDAAWLLWVLVEASRHAEVVLLCSDEVVLEHILPAQDLSPFVQVCLRV